jgi:hypothetical protein
MTYFVTSFICEFVNNEIYLYLVKVSGDICLYWVKLVLLTIDWDGDIPTSALALNGSIKYKNRESIRDATAELQDKFIWSNWIPVFKINQCYVPSINLLALLVHKKKIFKY